MSEDIKKYILKSHHIDGYNEDCYKEIDFKGTESQAITLCELMEHMAYINELGMYTCDYEEVNDNE